MRKEKREKLLREYVELLAENIIYEQSALGLEASPLYAAFVQPFTDAAAIAVGEVQKIGNVAVSTFEQGVILFRGLGGDPNWREALAAARGRLANRLGQINQELRPAWERIERAMANGDASAVAFLLNPGVFIGSRLIGNQLGSAIGLANELTNNSSPALRDIQGRYNRLLHHPANLLNPAARPDVGTIQMGGGGYGGGDYGGYGGMDEQVQYQQPQNSQTQVDPRVQQKIAQEMQKLQTEFQTIMNSSETKQLINSQPDIVAAQRTFLDGIFQKATTSSLLSARNYEDWKKKNTQQANDFERRMMGQEQKASGSSSNNNSDQASRQRQVLQGLEAAFQQERQREKQVYIKQLDQISAQSQNAQLQPVIQQYKTRIQSL